VDRPAADVFAYATDPTRFHEWQQGLIDGHLDPPGPAQVGTKCLTTRRIGGASRAVRAAGMTERMMVQPRDICALPFADDSFDIVVAEAVTMFADRRRSASELARVCVPGGQVLAGLHGRRVAAAPRQPGAGSGWAAR
jgi:SAM-dependent methyltransferase